MDAVTLEFLERVKRRCDYSGNAFCATSTKTGAYVEIGARQRMTLLKDGTTFVDRVLQRTIRDIYLPKQMRRRGFLAELVLYLAAKGGPGGTRLHAVQIEAVMNPKLRESLSSNSFGGLPIQWHDQTYDPTGRHTPTPPFNPSFVWFC
jgi:hypothetical protein